MIEAVKTLVVCDEALAVPNLAGHLSLAILTALRGALVFDRESIRGRIG